MHQINMHLHLNASTQAKQLGDICIPAISDENLETNRPTCIMQIISDDFSTGTSTFTQSNPFSMIQKSCRYKFMNINMH